MVSSALSWKARWGTFSLVLMVTFSFVQLWLLFSILHYCITAFWEHQCAMSWRSLFYVVMAFSASNCILEFFVHRYMMHAMIVRWLKEITRRHRVHHRLTSISLVACAGRVAKRIHSRFEIVEDKQWQYVHFRDSLLMIFYAVNIPSLALLQWLFPYMPIVAGGYIAITISFVLYQVLHVIEHKPEAWWQAHTQGFFAYPLGLLRRFHQYHHMHAKYNMAIAGFFGIPLADILFGTFRLPKFPLVNTAVLSGKELALTPPSKLIVWLDAHVALREKRLIAGG